MEKTTTNRLAREKSPYLLQHAHNPVDWYPWGEEAFEKARREDKPVFLSIGYSTCHWCHVMEEESFENPEVAAVMNERVVSIKVDREERPDLDGIYMTAVQALTGSGGWPLSVFLTHDKKPFFGGTYWPPDNRWGRPGFVSVLKSVSDAWKNKREALEDQGRELVELIEKHAGAKAEKTFSLNEKTLQRAFDDLQSIFDPRHGGFGQGIKFPRTPVLSLLLRHWKRSNRAEALEMVEKTLSKMSAGGIQDSLGGGFHRYATDSQWFLPHFEKMLYDQALIAAAYLEAYQAARKISYADTAREILDYVLRDLRDSGGGFYSAEDADSLDPAAGRKREGAFYVWTKQEILDLLGPEKGEIFSFVYGVRPAGNVFNDPQGEFPGKNVLSRVESAEEAGKNFGKSPEEIATLLNDSKKILFEARQKRTRPHLDDKVLTDWNGLMISTLAFAARVLEEPRYHEAAAQASDFILKTLVQKNGRLLHRYRDGEAAILGNLDDYAFLIHGLIDLYQSGFETRYLKEAKRLTEEMLRLFWDSENKGFFFTAPDSEALPARRKEIYDGAVPSGNSVAALDLIRLGRLTQNREIEARAGEIFTVFSQALHENPEAYPQMMLAFDFALGPSQEIVFAGEFYRMRQYSKALYSRFSPNQVILFHPSDSQKAREIEALAPFIKEQVAKDGRFTVYVCRNHVCRFPVTEVSEMEKLLL